jgi:hypothetical protein
MIVIIVNAGFEKDWLLCKKTTDINIIICDKEWN